MTRAETEKVIDTLRAKQVELCGAVRHRDDIVIEKAPDALDEVQQMGEREFAIRNLDRDTAMLRQVRHALARVADGSYGECLHCQEQISPKRLAAVPWAGYCIRCQEQIDRREVETNEPIELTQAA